MLGEPLAPGAVGQDHRLGDDQIERRAALARADGHWLVALRLAARGVVELEVVVGPVEVLGLAANDLALALEVPGQAVQKGHFNAPLDIDGCSDLRRFEEGFGEGVVERIVAQVAGDGHLLQPGAAPGDFQRRLVHRQIERQGRAVAAFLQRVGLHHIVGQHGQLVAGHVDGGHARAADRVNRAARQHRQAGRGNVNAQRDDAGAQALNRQRIVDLGGAGVVDGKRANVNQWQLVLDGRRLQFRKARAFRKVLEQEALPVELVGRGDGAGFLQQIKRRGVGGARGIDHGLVFGAVLVRLEQDLVELVANWRRTLAAPEFVGPGGDLRRDLLFLLDGGERLLQDFGRRFLEPALAGAAEIMRRVVQAEQRGGLLLRRGGLGGVSAEILARQFGKAEFLVAGEFPGQVQVDFFNQALAGGDEFGGRGFFELQQRIGCLDLDALARVEFDLQRTIGFRQNPAGQELAGFFKQYKHNEIL